MEEDSHEKKQKRKKRLEILIKKNKTTNAGQETPMCMICMEKIPDTIFHKCGHGGFCFECAKIIVETKALCHYCRAVRGFLKVAHFEGVED